MWNDDDDDDNDVEVFGANEKSEIKPVEELLKAAGIHPTRHLNERDYIEVPRGPSILRRTHYLSVRPGQASKAEKIVDTYLRAHPPKKESLTYRGIAWLICFLFVLMIVYAIYQDYRGPAQVFKP